MNIRHIPENLPSLRHHGENENKCLNSTEYLYAEGRVGQNSAANESEGPGSH